MVHASMSGPAGETTGGGDRGSLVRAWGSAIAEAAVMLVASFVLLALVPNQLLTFLSRHVAPKLRDIVVTLWWIVAFVSCSWLFLRLQRRRVN
jgi:Na+-driven multidrug efflux pump